MSDLLKSCLILLVIFCLTAPAWAITEFDLRNAILGRTAASSGMDQNNDNQLDVADLIKFITENGSGCEGLTGEHVGTFYRDGGNLIEGRDKTTGQINFALKITSESPLTGEIDNRSTSEMGHYSLYFPSQRIPVTLRQPSDNRLEFEFNFTTASSNLSPNAPLNRHMKFSGEFSDAKRRVISGTYEEEISGFKNNQGDEIPVHLTGSFMMVLECDQ